jgi:anti-sigma regulatory factor (Ser/Thr protein kinase)
VEWGVRLVETEHRDRPDALTRELTDQAPTLAAVRRWVADALADLADDARDDCLLVVNELVSNAYDHGSGPRGIRLRRTARPCVVRFEVDDARPDRPVLGRSRLGVDRGRGLVIVHNLALDWGVSPRLDGKTVWAELACAPA